jgi:hypothetical protein
MLQQIDAEYEAPEGELLPTVEHFFLTPLYSFSNSICFLCSRRMVRSPGTMMAPSSHSHQLPPWSFLAKTHLPRQRPSCGSSLAPQNQLPNRSEPLTLLPPLPSPNKGEEDDFQKDSERSWTIFHRPRSSDRQPGLDCPSYN